MAYTVQGKVIDKDKSAIPFALVYTSDANGKPVTPSKNTQTDDKGFWKINDLTDSDLISIRNLGYKTKTFSAKSVPNVSLNEFMPPQRSVVTTLQPDEALSTLQEVPIIADRPKTTPKPTASTPNKKPPYGLYIMIGGLLILATALILDKKTAK